MQRTAGEKHCQGDGTNAQGGQRPAHLQKWKKITLNRIDQGHQPDGDRQGGGEAEVNLLARQPQDQQRAVYQPGQPERCTRHWGAEQWQAGSRHRVGDHGAQCHGQADGGGTG